MTKDFEKSNAQSFHVLEIRTVRLETQFESMSKQLDKIGEDVRGITNTLYEMNEYLSEHKGSVAAKTKIWVSICSFVAVITALGLHTIAYKLFGLEI